MANRQSKIPSPRLLAGRWGTVVGISHRHSPTVGPSTSCTDTVVEAHPTIQGLAAEEVAAVATEALRGLAGDAARGADHHHVVLSVTMATHTHRSA